MKTAMKDNRLMRDGGSHRVSWMSRYKSFFKANRFRYELIRRVRAVPGINHY